MKLTPAGTQIDVPILALLLALAKFGVDSYMIIALGSQEPGLEMFSPCDLSKEWPPERGGPAARRAPHPTGPRTLLYRPPPLRRIQTPQQTVLTQGASRSAHSGVLRSQWRPLVPVNVWYGGLVVLYLVSLSVPHFAGLRYSVWWLL